MIFNIVASFVTKIVVRTTITNTIVNRVLASLKSSRTHWMRSTIWFAKILKGVDKDAENIGSV